VLIDPGEYRDCAVWRADGLLVESAGGTAHLRDVSCEGKGIWVVYGDGMVVRGIRFSGSTVPNRNGAGIKLEGGSLGVHRSWFHDNENGILSGSRDTATVLIEDSRFERNGKCEPDCAHGIYIGRVGKLTVRRSVFREQRIGHHIKSRALVTEVIDCVIEDGPEGTASYDIDLPNGGSAVIRGNHIQKGPRTDNQEAMISIGEEPGENPGFSYVVEDNRALSDLVQPTIFVRNSSRIPAYLRGNVLEGSIRPLVGAGEVRP
jgi:hypothetical protein